MHSFDDVQPEVVFTQDSSANHVQTWVEHFWSQVLPCHRSLAVFDLGLHPADGDSPCGVIGEVDECSYYIRMDSYNAKKAFQLCVS